MPRKGLTKTAIVDAAIALIEEQGNRAFSLNELARCLAVRPASLYNHFENMEVLTGAVGFRIAEMIRRSELDAIAGMHGDEALFALCDAYRAFAREHMDLYKVIMGMQKDKNACTETACGEMIEPILLVLSDYGLTESDKMHWQRILRAMMHGFITHEYAGGFRHYPADHNETYRMAIQMVALGIHTAQKESEQ
ncbi:MAG: TetR/AcrR family transcriptional regulator [Clostridia bacterium]|nr:TetR/AcrR family transcriptional regulator [Clostridia bacterium]